MKNIKDYPCKDLGVLLKKFGLPRFCAEQLFGWIYKKRVEEFSQMSDLSMKLRSCLEENFYCSQIELKERKKSKDKTEKFLFSLSDGSLV